VSGPTALCTSWKGRWLMVKPPWLTSVDPPGRLDTLHAPLSSSRTHKTVCSGCGPIHT
jgi:hypothetical protein